MPEFEKKSFSVPALSPDADPADFAKRWKETFNKDLDVAPDGSILGEKTAKYPTVTYPIACCACGAEVGARDHHWILDGKVQCSACGPFGEFRGEP